MRKIGAVLCATGFVVATLAACGSSAKTPIQVVTGASAATSSAKTAHFAATITVKTQTIQMDGTLDLAGHRGQFTETLPGLGTLDFIQDSLIGYAKLPAAISASLGGKPWLKVDAAAVAQKATGIDLSSLIGNQTGPTSGLTWLRGAGADFHSVGSEVIRGAKTTHYAGSVDLAKASAAEPDPARRQALRQEAKLLGVPTMAIDVWIDSSNRMVQMHYVVDMSKMQLPSGATQATGTVDTRFTLFDFGTPFTMPALPPADQTTDLGALLGGLGGPGAGAGGGTTTTAPTVQASGVAAQLRKALVTPTGFAPSTATDVTNGPMDGAAFDSNFGAPGLATRLGFVGGYDETYDKAAGTDSVDVMLLQFASTSQPAALVQIVTAAKPADATQSHLTSIPGALQFDVAKAADGTYEHDIFAVKGNRLMLITYTTATSGPVAALSTIAVRQYQRI